jgi:nucleotide sugar dehydrogenase
LVTHKIAIIGSGVVGSATGKGFQKLGQDVTFFDISKARLLALREEGYQVAESMNDAISEADVCLVCVNTPPSNMNFTEANADLGKHQDLSQLLSALRDIVSALNDSVINKKRLLVFRSTMVPGTMRNVVLDFLERNCALKRGEEYNVCYNPEFLRQSSALEDFFTPDRVVIGEDISGSSLPLSDLYSLFTKNIITMGYEEAEMVKYASNCFLALKISYFNEISMICRSMRINDEEVSSAVSLDKRIGDYGTKGGRPFGGACFPKDTEAFASFARKINMKPELIETAISINKQLEELTYAKPFVKEQQIKDSISTFNSQSITET